jgi:hypothetical protein
MRWHDLCFGFAHRGRSTRCCAPGTNSLLHSPGVQVAVGNPKLYGCRHRALQRGGGVVAGGLLLGPDEPVAARCAQGGRHEGCVHPHPPLPGEPLEGVGAWGCLGEERWISAVSSEETDY